MKIGITERGDASIDYSWVEKLKTVDGAILITKNVTDKFIETVLPFQDKVILHATVTGYGRTKLEPNVMSPIQSFKQLNKLREAGFHANHIVLRVDPIIPTERGIRVARDIIEYGYREGIRRVRVSVLDMYPHVRERFSTAGIPLPYGNNFSATKEQFMAIDNMLQFCLLKYCSSKFSIESCAEPLLQEPIHTGCVGPKDFEILGLTAPEETLSVGAKQRKTCLCCSCKTELLNNREQCPNGCLYCYWKNKNI